MRVNTGRKCSCYSLWLWNQRMKNNNVSVSVEAKRDRGIYSGWKTAHAVSSKGPWKHTNMPARGCIDVNITQQLLLLSLFYVCCHGLAVSWHWGFQQTFFFYSSKRLQSSSSTVIWTEHNDQASIIGTFCFIKPGFYCHSFSHDQILHTKATVEIWERSNCVWKTVHSSTLLSNLLMQK